MAAGLLPRSLSLLPPELAHAATLGALRMSGYLPSPAAAPTSRPVRMAGLEFANRVGLAAGFDKNGIAVDGLARLGFGFLEIGTVTPKPQPGNARPRVFRYRHVGALVNRLGFPHDGADVVAARLRGRRDRGVLGVNIGKNAATPIERAVDDYVACFEALQGVADYLVVNVSSPNTAELRSLQQPERLRVILESFLEARPRRANERALPLFLKISRDLGRDEFAELASILSKLRWDGLIATNTTLRRPHGRPDADRVAPGGLSGRPLFPFALDALRQLRVLLPDTLIIGCGGIQSPQDAIEMRRSGADLVQLYTGLIYRGASLIKDISAALAADDRRRSVSA